MKYNYNKISFLTISTMLLAMTHFAQAQMSSRIPIADVGIASAEKICRFTQPGNGYIVHYEISLRGSYATVTTDGAGWPLVTRRGSYPSDSQAYYDTDSRQSDAQVTLVKEGDKFSLYDFDKQIYYFSGVSCPELVSRVGQPSVLPPPPPISNGSGNAATARVISTYTSSKGYHCNFLSNNTNECVGRDYKIIFSKSNSNNQSYNLATYQSTTQGYSSPVFLQAVYDASQTNLGQSSDSSCSGIVFTSSQYPDLEVGLDTTDGMTVCVYNNGDIQRNYYEGQIP